MRRALIVAAVLGLLVSILWFAQESLLLTSLAVGGFVVSGLLWWWLRRPEAAASLAVVLLTLVVTSEVTFWLAARVPGVDVLQLGFGFWVFTLVTAAGTWLAPRHPGNRAVTLTCTGAILAAASFGAVLAPAVLPVVGFALAAAVLVWRTRRPRLRPRPLPPATDDRSASVRGVQRTWDRLIDSEATLAAAGVELLGPQRVGRVEVELLLRTPDGLLVVQTRQWGGRVRLTDTGEYALDGAPEALTSRLAPTVRLLRAVRRSYGGRVAATVVFWDGTDLPEEVVPIDVLAGRRAHGRVTLVRGDGLVAGLLDRARVSAEPTS